MGESQLGRRGPASPKRPGVLRSFRKYAAAYALLAPFFVTFAVFLLFPILFAFYISFFDWPGMGVRTFIGLENYQLLFTDPQFLRVLVNTLLIGLGHVVPVTFLSLLLAVLIDARWVKFKGFWQVSVFLPSVTATVVIAIVFNMLLSTNYGVVNEALASLRLPAVPWLDETGWARLSIAGIINWRWTGYNTLIVLAGLKGIPSDLYEAATLDGANGAQKLLFITLPMLRSVLLFVSITSTIGALQLFTEPYILAPDSAPTLGLYLYQTAFQYFKFGYGSAIAYFITVVVFVLSLVQLRFFGGQDS